MLLQFNLRKLQKEMGDMDAAFLTYQQSFGTESWLDLAPVPD
jgi:hypothetical protein